MLHIHSFARTRARLALVAVIALASLATGCVKSSESRSDFRSEEWGLIQFETMVMTPDSRPDPQKLSVAKALLLSSNLPDDLKSNCLKQLGG